MLACVIERSTRRKGGGRAGREGLERFRYAVAPRNISRRVRWGSADDNWTFADAS
jgi:hypothetical protein